MRRDARAKTALRVALGVVLVLLPAAAAAQDAALLAKAQAGDAAAQDSLGNYYYGLHTPDGYTKSAEWYRKAADKGDAKAEYSLGISYCWHEGVPQDYAEGYFWIDVGIESGVDDVNHWRNYAASHLTAEQITSAKERASKWLAAHPHQTAGH